MTLQHRLKQVIKSICNVHALGEYGGRNCAEHGIVIAGAGRLLRLGSYTNYTNYRAYKHITVSKASKLPVLRLIIIIGEECLILNSQLFLLPPSADPCA